MRMRKKYLFIILVLVLLISVFIVGCIGQTVAQLEPTKQHVDYVLASVPLSLDPAKLQDEAGYQFWINLFEGLVRLQPDGTLAEAMAEDWQIEDGGKKYIFTLRESAVWSDGQKVSADNFVSAIKRNLTPVLHCPYAYLLYDIKNAEAYHRSLDQDYFGHKANVDEVGIWAEDERTLVIELENREPAFLKKLIHPVFYPLPVQAFQTENGDFFTIDNLVGNGPFKIQQQVESEGKYELIKNESYWDSGTVMLESMNWYLPSQERTAWELFEKKQVDLTTDLPFTEVAKGLKKGYLQKNPLLVTYFYQFNVKQKPLEDLRVREALSFALDRGKLVTDVLQGGQEPAQGLIPTGMPDSTANSDFRQNSTKKIPDNNKEEAQRLLTEAGYPNGEGFPELEFLVSNSGGHQYLAEKIAEQWAESLGIRVKVIPLAWQDLLKRMSARDYDIGLLGWVADYPDPSAFLKYLVTGSGNNDTGWCNEEYDRLIKEALNSDEEVTRMQAFHQAEELLLAELPLLPLYEYNKVYACREKIEGLYFSPLGHGFDFKWTSVK
jgi:oligopeptide transport system substrate-binding protein